MAVFLLVLFTLLLLFGLIVSKKNVFSPSVITTAVWIFCLLLYLVLKHNLPPLTEQFLGAISLWVFLLYSSALLIQSTKVSNNFNFEASKVMMDIYFWISIFTFPSLLYYAYTALSLGSTGYWATDLRMAAIGKTANFTEVYSALFVTVWQISYLLELFYYSRANRHRVFILAFFYLSFGVVIMSKIIFLEFFLITICVLYFKKVVSIKHLLIGLCVLFLFFVAFQSIRYNSEDTDKNKFLITYIVGNMSAFDTLTPCSSNHFAENTFRIFYAITYKLNLSPIEPVSAFQPFIHKPLSTNTYTIMYPFFKDFGYWGIGIFAVFYGLFFGWLFKKAQNGSTFFILLFSVLIIPVIMQYASELFFSTISGKIKFIILLLLPFLAKQYKWFVLKKK